jgi:hypothetical protein
MRKGMQEISTSFGFKIQNDQIKESPCDTDESNSICCFPCRFLHEQFTFSFHHDTTCLMLKRNITHALLTFKTIYGLYLKNRIYSSLHFYLLVINSCVRKSRSNF